MVSLILDFLASFVVIFLIDEQVLLLHEIFFIIFFPFSKVDANTDYDDLDMLEIDEQDQYFDSESPEILSRGEESSDSSISFNSTVPRPKNLEEKMASLGN